MATFKLGLIGAFALVFVLGNAPAFAQAADEADSDTVELDISGIVSDLADGLDTDVELKEQYSVGDVTADLDLTITGGTDVTATAAAIANSMTVDSVTGIALYSDQESTGEVIAEVLADVADSAGDVSVTAAAMGNSLSATSDDGLNYSLILQGQNDGGTADAPGAGILAGVSGATGEDGVPGTAFIDGIGGGAAITAAALGNSATIDALEVDSLIDQSSGSLVESFIDADLWDIGTTAEITAAAIGNSASSNSATGADVNLTQDNTGELVAATVDNVIDGVGGTEGAVDTSAVVTSAAISNSGSVSAETFLDLDSTQVSGADVVAESAGQMIGITGDASVTAASIANSLTATSAVSDGFVDNHQTNTGASVTADIENSMTGITGNATATAAAISNSASVDVDTYLDLYSVQTSDADVDASYFGDVEEVTGSVNLTAAGIANSVSATSQMDDGIVTSDQHNYGWNVTASVEESTSKVFNELEATAAALGNSATFVSQNLDLVSTQGNTADMLAEVALGAVLDGGDVTGTAASIGNSLSGTADGTGDFNSDQTNDGMYVTSDLTGTLDGLVGNVSLTGAALGNSLTLESVGTQESEIEQNNVANISSSVMSLIGMGDESSIGEAVTATSAAIANSASIVVK